ncbi:MSMEG_0570 family nitrogen starvation response protein [Actinomycetospora endophytica]|uniref:MSMEG_0570 family nitrogen starvation response protein n=1 Tax=Actinomycetospora endophytica TaxID=2291215 RepID=A0ABS8PCD2_9PSEU|nr:MSMEG_0570 family nitrogen starvation response protein [Actinomycetospora endophytica]MCD2195912.1 MSMEG_0570 family nitrogen starvation response protein [Actinomycetospora endophytica]
MPEMHVRLRWPDGTRERVYSPSLVLAEHLDAGTAYPLEDFARRSREALTEASERVRAKYGFPCSRAAASLAGIEARVRRYGEGDVLVEAVET